MTRSPLLLLAQICVVALVVGLSACRSADQDDVDGLRIELAQLSEAALRAQILAALEPLDPLRYHELDSIVRNDQRIAAEAVIWARRARETLAWVDWPPELNEHVEQYSDWLDSLLAAFDKDDAVAASEPSKIVHALAHTFEATLEAWLNNESLPAVPALAGLEPPTHDDSQGGHGGDGQQGNHNQ